MVIAKPSLTSLLKLLLPFCLKKLVFFSFRL